MIRRKLPKLKLRKKTRTVKKSGKVLRDCSLKIERIHLEGVNGQSGVYRPVITCSVLRDGSPVTSALTLWEGDTVKVVRETEVRNVGKGNKLIFEDK